MDIRKAAVSWDKISRKIEKFSEDEKELVATYAQGIIARGKLEKSKKEKAG